jgi:hypothetical protein
MPSNDVGLLNATVDNADDRRSQLTRSRPSPRIHLVLTDDWEVRGDGSGNVRAIQFETMRRLRRVYEKCGLRASFNVEVMQQLAHLRLADKHPELRQLAIEWEVIVRDTFSCGHDVQLHVHPQWSDAVYNEGRWQLRGAWSILEYPVAEAQSMLKDAKDYLESLLRPLNPEYRCVSFRSGSWCIAPSKYVLPILSELGIVFDMSIADGLFYETPRVKLDYRHLDEPFLPYYPMMEDARRVATAPQPIVCIPTHTFHAGLIGFGLRLVARTVQRRTSVVRSVTRRFVAPRDTAIPDGGYERDSYFQREWDAAPLQGVARRKKKVSDLCGLSFFQMREMLRDIRKRARRSGFEVIPVVLENHSKDLGDFAPLELFAREVTAARDLQVITLSELARNIEAGVYSVKRADA